MSAAATDLALLGPSGEAFSLGMVEGKCLCELRWLCAGVPVTLRDLVGIVERYEPACSLTARGIIAAPVDVSTVRLRDELRRLRNSAIVLNRLLRERVQASASSMSEIALRCDRTKRDRNGTESGETSWLTRRLGMVPEGGQLFPTPWISSNVLALIAREGLGIMPRDVEVDVQEDVTIEDHWCVTCHELVTTGPDAVCPWCETWCTTPWEVAA